MESEKVQMDVFRDVVEAAPTAIIVTDSDGKIVLLNKQAETYFGYARGELLGEAIELLIPARFQPQHLGHRADFWLKPSSRPMGIGRKLYGLRKDGSEFPVEIGLNPLETAGGTLVLAAVVDVSQRQEVESKFRLAVEAAPNGIIMINSQGKITLVNSQLERYFGYASHELIGQPVEMLIPKRFHQGHPHLRQTFLQQPESRPMGTGRDLYAVRKDGTEFPVEVGLNPIETETGLEVLAMIVDISQRKQVEQALQESQARLTGTINSAMDAIITLDSEQRIVLFNPAAEQMFGLPAATVIGQPIDQFIPERFRQAHRNHIRAFGQTGVTSRRMGSLGNITGRRVDGTEFPIEASISHIKAEDQPLYTVILRDITERQQAEAERAQLWHQERAARTEAEVARTRLAFLAEASQLMAASLDYHSTLAHVAQLAVPDIGDWCAIDILDKEEALKRVAVVHSDQAKVELALKLQERYPPDLNDSHGVAQVIRTGQSELYEDISDTLLESVISDPELLTSLRQLGLKSGMVVPMLTHEQTLGAITLVSAESGRRYGPSELDLVEELARRAALAVDNARLYWAAQQLNTELEARVKERTARLEAANKELEAFSYSVSHDLRAPLRAIDAFSRILLDDYALGLDSSAQDFLDSIRTNTQQMGELIDDLLTFSRLGRQPLQKQAVNTADLVQAILAELQPTQAGREVELIINSLPTCQADPKLLKLVWMNLLTNAFKYTGNRTVAKIEIGCQIEAAEQVFFVKDNGVGFDMQYASKLFGVFQRLHRAEDYDGTGVGLALVQRIVQRHGGQVWAEAAVDRGASFYFALTGGEIDDSVG